MATNQTVSGTFTGAANSAQIRATEGTYVLLAQGTFGASVTLQFSLDGGTTWTAAGSDTTLTAAGGGVAEFPANALIRVNAGSVTDVDYHLGPRP